MTITTSDGRLHVRSSEVVRSWVLTSALAFLALPYAAFLETSSAQVAGVTAVLLLAPLAIALRRIRRIGVIIDQPTGCLTVNNLTRTVVAPMTQIEDIVVHDSFFGAGTFLLRRDVPGYTRIGVLSPVRHLGRLGHPDDDEVNEILAIRSRLLFEIEKHSRGTGGKEHP